jgi:glycine/D-amino acid oxidase-like deaminating enzyme/nitrite reductase/ring-hydroxylating ferredoxin subunit
MLGTLVPYLPNNYVMNESKKKSLRDGQTESIWQEQPVVSIDTPEFPLSQTFDALIVGAGITGITTALLLQKAGKKCVVVEAGSIGFGTTGGTSAHLNTFFDTTYPEIESDFDKDAARLAADSAKDAFSMIDSLIQEYNIDCDFEYKEGFLYSENKEETEQLKEILESSRRAGVAVEESETNNVNVPFEMSICFKAQGQFHPLKYVNSLAKEFINLGGIILDQTFVSESLHQHGLHVTTAGDHLLRSVDLIYATHIPPGITAFSLRCAPYRSYVLGLKLRDQLDYPDGLIYDMQEPYHYFRTHEIDGQKILLVGGEDHKSGHDDPEKAFENLEEFIKQYYAVDEVSYKWSSQYYVPVDGLPYIGNLGKSTDHTYIATGFNGNGMMFGTLSGMVISDLILDNENKFSELYSPSRMKPVAGFSEFVKENTDVAYHFVADRFSTEDLKSVTDLEIGEGKVVELNGKKVAVHKNFDGDVTSLHPVCSHAGCVVSFNKMEQSWDCPCHGARFDVSGKVISGPPRKHLEQVVI